MMLIAYHPDLSNGCMPYGSRFRKRSNIDWIAQELNVTSVHFPDGPGKKWNSWGTSDDDFGQRQLDWFDDYTQGEQCIQIGYSRGGMAAAFLASHRSSKTVALACYAAILMRTRFSTSRKFPVVEIWNKRDKRRRHSNIYDAFKRRGHMCDRFYSSRGGHWSNWQPEVNKRIVDHFNNHIVL